MEALQSPALSVSEAVSGYSDFIENQSLGGGGSSSLGSGMVGGTKSNALTIGLFASSHEVFCTVQYENTIFIHYFCLDSRKRDETAPLGMTDSGQQLF